MPQIKTESEDNYHGYSSMMHNEAAGSNRTGSFRQGPSAKQRKTANGGRRPKEENVRWLSPEEKNKRDQRRLRNKEAAARCRQRRLDKMNTLQEQVDELMDKQHLLESEIERLENVRAQLQGALISHNCKCGGIKPSLLSQPIVIPVSATRTNKRSVEPAQGVVVRGDPFMSPVDNKRPRLVKMESVDSTGSGPVIGMDVSFAIPAVSRPTSEPKRPDHLSIGIANSANSLDTPGILLETPSRAVSYAFDPLVSGLLEGSTGVTPTTVSLTPILVVSSSANLNLDTPTISDVSITSASNDKVQKALLQL